MADTPEEWHAANGGQPGWWIYASPSAREVARNLSKNDARRIVREHNLYPRLAKLAEEELNPAEAKIASLKRELAARTEERDKLQAEVAKARDVADPEDGRSPDEQLEDLLGYMDVLEQAIDRAGVGDEARALDKPRAVDEAISILMEQRDGAEADLARLTAPGQTCGRCAEHDCHETRECQILWPRVRELEERCALMEGALDGIRKHMGRPVFLMPAAMKWINECAKKALAHEPAGSKRLRAIVEAAEAESEMHQRHVEFRNADPQRKQKEGLCQCGICKAVRMPKGE